MPTYEYECQKCNFRFERFQAISEKPITRCPECRGKVRRLISAGAGFLFKGSGFYSTDYRKPSYYKEKEKSEKSKAEASDSKSSCSGTPSTCEKPECPSKK